MESEWRKLGETVNVERRVGDDEGEGQETMKKMKTVQMAECVMSICYVVVEEGETVNVYWEEKKMMVMMSAVVWKTRDV